MSKHPIQPLELDEHGVLRFKENKIVRYLIDNGNIDLNKIACRGFDNDEREHFAQLIGYSYDGACTLSYVSSETLDIAHRLYESPEQAAHLAREKWLRGKLQDLKRKFREAVAALYERHPDDFMEQEDAEE